MTGLCNIKARNICSNCGFEEEIKAGANNIKELDLAMDMCNIDLDNQKEILNEACIGLVRDVLSYIAYGNEPTKEDICEIPCEDKFPSELSTSVNTQGGSDIKTFLKNEGE